MKFISSKTIIYYQIFFSKIWSKVFRLIFTSVTLILVYLIEYFSDDIKEERSLQVMIIILGIYGYILQFAWSKVKQDSFLDHKNYMKLFSRICDSNLKRSINELKILEFYKNIEAKNLQALSFFDKLVLHFSTKETFLDKFFGILHK